jgi:hypothetical protein
VTPGLAPAHLTETTRLSARSPMRPCVRDHAARPEHAAMEGPVPPPRSLTPRTASTTYPSRFPASSPPAVTIESPYVMRARGLVQLVLSAMRGVRRIKA